MRTTIENPYQEEVRPDMMMASPENATASPDQNFDASAAEAVQKYSTISEKWVSKLGSLFNGGKREAKQAPASGTSWMSKIKSSLNKGLDFAVEKSVQFRDEGFDHKKIFNDLNTFVSTGLYNMAGGDAIKRNFEGYHSRTEEKESIVHERAETENLAATATAEPNPENVKKAKTGIASRSERLLKYGENSMFSAILGKNLLKGIRNLKLNAIKFQSFGAEMGEFKKGLVGKKVTQLELFGERTQ